MDGIDRLRKTEVEALVEKTDSEVLKGTCSTWLKNENSENSS